MSDELVQADPVSWLSQLQAVLLDMDGTLVDSDAAVERSWRTWALEYRVDPGRGPGEAYRDTFHATRVGRFTAPVGALATAYVRPQENGNRMHARNLTLTAAAGQCLTVTADPPVDFAVRRWSPELLTAARHTPELVPDGRTHVHLDAAHHGIGSASCGPPLPPGHRLAAHTVAYTLGFSA